MVKLSNIQNHFFYGCFGDDETTGVNTLDGESWIKGQEPGAWYSLDGRRLSGKPEKKGIYVHQGRRAL